MYGYRLHRRRGVTVPDRAVDPAMVGLEVTGVAQPYDGVDGEALDGSAQGLHDRRREPVARGLGDGGMEGDVVLDELLRAPRRVHGREGPRHGLQSRPRTGRVLGGPLLD